MKAHGRHFCGHCLKDIGLNSINTHFKHHHAGLSVKPHTIKKGSQLPDSNTWWCRNAPSFFFVGPNYSKPITPLMSTMHAIDTEPV